MICVVLLPIMNTLHHEKSISKGDNKLLITGIKLP